MHNFIVYQYGKVGSTSITQALNELPDVCAHQCHFLGDQAFEEVLNRLLDPTLPDYTFKHSAGQLVENLRIYRYYLRREIDAGRLTIISLAREPFDWFRSAMAQDIEEHRLTLDAMLEVRGIQVADDKALVVKGMLLLFDRLLEAINLFESLDKMCGDARYPVLESSLSYTDPKDYRSLVYFLNVFLRPHVWFSSQFEPVLDVKIKDLVLDQRGIYKKEASWGGTYLLNYENLQETYPRVMRELGYAQSNELPLLNHSGRKPFADELEEVFSSDAAIKLRTLCHSGTTRYLGYAPFISGELK